MVASKEKPVKQDTSTPAPQDQVVFQQVVYKPEPERTLFEWSAKERPFKRRNKEFWVSIIAMAAIAGFILYLIEGMISVMLIVAIVFLFYVLSTVEPQTTTYKITTRGITIADKFNNMDFFTRFWFAKRFTSDILVVEMLSFPGRIEMVINSSDKEAIRSALSDYLVEDKANPTNLDNAADWVAKKIPGN